MRRQSPPNPGTGILNGQMPRVSMAPGQRVQNPSGVGGHHTQLSWGWQRHLPPVGKTGTVCSLPASKAVHVRLPSMAVAS